MKPHIITAFEKALNVIESCKTVEHIEVAEQYVIAFSDMYGDGSPYTGQLVKSYWIKSESICPKDHIGL